jgi:hypothetical protein
MARALNIREKNLLRPPTYPNDPRCCLQSEDAHEFTAAQEFAAARGPLHKEQETASFQAWVCCHRGIEKEVNGYPEKGIVSCKWRMVIMGGVVTNDVTCGRLRLPTSPRFDLFGPTSDFHFPTSRRSYHNYIQ